MAEARRFRTEVRRFLRWIHRTPHGRDGAQLTVALATAAIVLALFALLADGIGVWAIVAAGLPVAIEVVKQSRTAWRRRHDQQREISMAELPRADLSRRALASSYLRGRDLTSAKLVMTDLHHADLTGAVLDDARLRKANLSYADLTEASCRSTSFFRARLVEANLDGIDGREASFQEADLRHASLVGADLGGVGFDGADVRGANFARSVMAPNALAEATTDAATVLPDGRPATGVGRPTIAGWRASMVRAARLGLWELVRPIAVGLTGVAVIAGVAGASELSLEVSLLEMAGPDGGVEAPRSDLFGRLSSGDRSSRATTPTRTAAVAPSEGASSTADVDPDAVAPTADDGGDRPIGDGEPGSSAAGIGELPLPDLAPPTVGPTTTTPSPDPSEPVPSSTRPATGSTDPTTPDVAEAAAATEPSLEEVVETPTEAPGPDPGAAQVLAGLQIVVTSESGPSTVTLQSLLGDGAFVVTGRQVLDLDGEPTGPIQVEVVPGDGATVASCSIVIDGVEVAFRRGFDGEAIGCQVDLDRQ